MLSIQPTDHFEGRHIGISEGDLATILRHIGVDSLDTLIEQTVPSSIRLEQPLHLPSALTESEYLTELKGISLKNQLYKNFIGLGYYGTLTPSVILRNVFENPGWYTQYTPYQAEISQGRLEALLNFQTMVCDLTGLPVANASLLDEATAAAEAMAMFFHAKNKSKITAPRLLVDSKIFPQTLAVLETRAIPLGIAVVVGDFETWNIDETVFAVLLQYPDAEGNIKDYSAITATAHAAGAYVIAAADILSLTLLTPPGEWGADAAVGTTQRFGIPLGYGGPHAAYFAVKEEFKRVIPGRIIGVSIDSHGNRALRMALQTREQHIRREKATSNICTAQALLANMAGFYAIYHGAEGLRGIAHRINGLTTILASYLKANGYEIENAHYFDTITLKTGKATSEIRLRAEIARVNLRFEKDHISISLDETTTLKDLSLLLSVFINKTLKKAEIKEKAATLSSTIPSSLRRTSTYLTHPVFTEYRSESLMMRYLKRLENKDLSLAHSMISLGSCTMKLNAATEMIPLSWAHWANLHPFAPVNQVEGYAQIFQELETYLAEITGFTACSLQPNSGAQGEYAGLLTIRAYHEARQEAHRHIALIPSSAHGTNPASAVMAGMQVVVVKCDDLGNIDVADLKEKAATHRDNLSCLMVTYPSTHGVFETAIQEICATIHQNGGLVYMDGANMNAQVGLTSPGHIGADVCHLNLHKTFAIPHGGGGPGMGPICVNDKLKPFLPSHPLTKTGGSQGIKAVSAAPWGSASILLISYAYIRLLGAKGVTNATKYAILNANYIKARLEGNYKVVYVGEHGRVAHELILDLRPFKAIGIEAEDVAKRLMDYGFHAPTLSFPIAGTIMIEPTESEDKAELDRFCEALLAIRAEIDEIATGEADKTNNVLKNAPHTLGIVTGDSWAFPYSREKAAFPLQWVRERKFWATIGRVNNAFGDRNVICTCPPIEEDEGV